ncbi:response regulator [Cohnella sp. CFH 77786]|uniref:response regulator n=1 Tax=Cohnella sp. CFH 77786 TaxID=2662265 RepID=UPI001C608C49|nr:response regulator [Cohnella sp. CFH 77786]MBW5447344.1 response regulator [Cohnella sp. CFH 77786]
MKVLIVDDASFMRMMLRKMIESEGHFVAGEAVDGNDAVAKYSQLRPDLVTMDISMPNKNGIEAVQEIRAIDKAAKILMISAIGQEPMVKAAILGGAYDFIMKPLDEELFKKALDRAARDGR